MIGKRLPVTIHCCYKCTERNIGCHSVCEKYISEKEAGFVKGYEAYREYRADKVVDKVALGNLEKRGKRYKK